MWKRFWDVVVEELYAIALHIGAVVIALLEFLFWVIWISPRLVWRSLQQIAAPAFAW